MKLWILSIFIIFSLWFVADSLAVPTCTYRSGSCNAGEVCLFNVLQENNSHVGSCSSDYTTKVCCTEITSATIRSSCPASEGGVVSLYATTNSHAGRWEYYSNVVCAKTSSNPVVTNVRTSCLARENCVVSVFQQNNTHIGKCGYYSTRLCVQELFNVTITMTLNNTSPNLGDWLELSGQASRSDASLIDTSSDSADVELSMNSSGVCVTDTNSTGHYACNFTAPLALGIYEVNVTIDDPTTGKTWSNATTFTVKQQIGETRTVEQTAESISCYEEPRVIQNPDGTIEIATVRICVWK